MLRSITNTSVKLERSNAASYKKVLRLAPLRRKKALFDRNNIRHHGGGGIPRPAAASGAGCLVRGWKRTSFLAAIADINHASALPRK